MYSQPSVVLPDGRRQLPVAAMVCNFPRPSESTPSLLPHDDVETLFHEFGHMMHIICARSDFEELGAFMVECDFVEMPSQVPYTSETITSHSTHPYTILMNSGLVAHMTHYLSVY